MHHIVSPLPSITKHHPQHLPSDPPRLLVHLPVSKEPGGHGYCSPGHLLRHGVEEDDGAHEHDVAQHAHHRHHHEDAADVRCELLVVYLTEEGKKLQVNGIV